MGLRLVPAGRFETKGGEKVFDHGVLGGGTISSANAAVCLFPRDPDQFISHKLFHSALQDAATHDPGIDDEGVVLPAEKENADESVIAEIIVEAKGQRQPVDSPISWICAWV